MARTLVVLLTMALPMLTAAEHDYGAARQKIVETIAELASRVTTPHGSGLAPAVLATMRQVPRHEFVPAGVRDAAYDNRPLSIGYGQTISQPFIVALMTDLARPDNEDVVLEIGTGSGYQAAVLSPLVNRVYAIEIAEALAKRATERLAGLSYSNVTVRYGDGYHGWPEHGPFDAIIVTAAPSHIPPPLVKQLKPGGRMVIPVGPPFMAQNLMLVEKDAQEQVHTRTLLPVQFVPLTGSRG
jgi:protein-L-isoaspartate(D-aspartate) O-methyltransferase